VALTWETCGLSEFRIHSDFENGPLFATPTDTCDKALATVPQFWGCATMGTFFSQDSTLTRDQELQGQTQEGARKVGPVSRSLLSGLRVKRAVRAQVRERTHLLAIDAGSSQLHLPHRPLPDKTVRDFPPLGGKDRKLSLSLGLKRTSSPHPPMPWESFVVSPSSELCNKNAANGTL
jgi:hypothetical protein